MPFERELIESSYKAWRRYIFWGLHKATGLCRIGERIQIKKWFLIWKEISRNRCQEQRLAIQYRVFERWVSFRISRKNYLHDLNKYFYTWEVHTRNEKHLRKIVKTVVRERRLLKLHLCINHWLRARHVSSDNSHEFQTLLKDYVLRRSKLRLPNVLAMTPLVILSKHWKMWRKTITEKIGASSDSTTIEIVPILSQEEDYDDKVEDTRSLTKDNTKKVKSSSSNRNKTDTPSESLITTLLRRKKESFSQSMKSVNDMTNLLKKSQYDIDVYDRSIKTCTKEIENHCCTCGGIHVFFDHEPAKMLNCKRLKAKNRSLMYLKKARQEAIERMTAFRSGVKQCEKESEEARRSLSLLLKDSLFNNIE